MLGKKRKKVMKFLIQSRMRRCQNCPRVNNRRLKGKKLPLFLKCLQRPLQIQQFLVTLGREVLPSRKRVRQGVPPSRKVKRRVPPSGKKLNRGPRERGGLRDKEALLSLRKRRVKELQWG